MWREAFSHVSSQSEGSFVFSRIEPGEYFRKKASGMYGVCKEKNS